MTEKTMTKAKAVMVPRFMVQALTECLDAGCVPSIREGEGGSSHSVWFVEFRLFDERKWREFTVLVTSSYSGKFLAFVPFAGPGFDGLQEYKSMAACVALAKVAVAGLKWSMTDAGRLRHEPSGVEFVVTPGDGFTDVVVAEDSLTRFNSEMRMKFAPADEVARQLMNLAQEGAGWIAGRKMA